MGLKLKLDRITCSREEFREGISLAPQKDLDIKSLPKNIKRIVLTILELNKELQVDLSTKNYVTNFLLALKKHSLEYYGLASLIESILGIGESSYIDRRTGLANDYKFLEDCNTPIKPKSENNFNTPGKEEFEKDCTSPGKKLVFILKIDGFSKINGFYGRSNGDIFINNIITKFKELFEVKHGFKLYKLSGLYFGLLTEKQFESSKELFEVMEEIRGIINSFHIDIEIGENKEKNELKIKLNGGCSHCNERLFDKSLLALYKSNKEGGLYFYTKEMEEIYKRELENNLLRSVKIIRGINENRFLPFYQGIRDNRTGKIIKYESLIRYRDDDGKIVSPYFFLDIAENMDKILDLSKIMVEKVIKKMTENNHCFSINLPEECLINDEFIRFLMVVLNDNQVDPNRLIIEILEKSIDKGGKIIEVIKRDLKGNGIKIAIDDFGTGFTNVGRLDEIRPDFLKIDGSLSKKMENEQGFHHIKIIKQIADIYGAEVIIEFIDNKEKQAKVDELEIPYTQGYLYSVPNEKLCDEI
ncbi:GGDEF domain-containing protein [Candidatus Gracilibacteria bacterium]|nr:GGDEF domain-containing protein [Candidatus Gracilibacteria bacterium]